MDEGLPLAALGGGEGKASSEEGKGGECVGDEKGQADGEGDQGQVPRAEGSGDDETRDLTEHSAGHAVQRGAHAQPLGALPLAVAHMLRLVGPVLGLPGHMDRSAGR